MNVVLADAENGVPEYAPYDRIIVTVGAWDIPPARVEQLAPGGRIVVPLRMRGLTRSLALGRDGDHLVSRSAMICGFVKMQGAGAHQERVLQVRGTQIGLRFDDGGPDDPHLLDGVLYTERAEVWSGVTIGRVESFDTLQFWLATTLPGFCLLAADGAHAFGPHAPAVVEAMVEQVRVWDRDHRAGPGPDFAVWRKDTPDEALPQGLIINPHEESDHHGSRRYDAGRRRRQ